MTPAERIAAALFDAYNGGSSGLDDMLEGVCTSDALIALDALCPKGSRVVLDRTGDTDRLIRQRRIGWTWFSPVAPWPLFTPDDGSPPAGREGIRPLWVDSPEGGE